MGTSNHARRGLRSSRNWSAVMGMGLMVGGAGASYAGTPFGYIDRIPVATGIPQQPNVARWRTWVLSSGRELRPAAPPSDRSATTLAEIQELRQLQEQRNAVNLPVIQYWNTGPATARWTELALSLIKRDRVSPVRAARLLGCLHTAMHDAVVASWDAKYAYRRRAPAFLARGVRPALPIEITPSYPSEHAAVAGAASGMLANLFPNEAAMLAGLEKEACESRLLAGMNYRSDVEVGVNLGKAVALKAIARAEADGSSAKWTGTPPTGPGFWFQAPGTPAPLEPLAGTWKPWILTSGSQLRPGPPPAFGSAQFLAELEEVKQVCNNATPAQRAIAIFWADGAGTATPPGHWFEIAGSLIARDRLDTPNTARILALLGATVTDAAISCWDTKYHYWLIRPVQADPSIQTIVPTPPFPSYTSGHSTFSGASSTVLGYFFPREA
jgi:membrane-associated phospholipid phosphatase